MKRFIAVLLFAALFAFASCGEGGDVRLNFATGGVTGTYYPLGGAMAAVINANTDISLTVMATNASADNIRQLAAGDAHIAIVQNDVMSYAFYGTGFWPAGEEVTNLATLMSLYPETVQIVVPADSDIYSVADLRGNRVSIGAPGSGVEANTLQILAAYGLSTDDITVFNLNFSDSANAMRDLMLDAFFITAATPNTAIMELSTSRDLRILELSEAAIQSLLANYPFYVRVTVDSRDYDFVTSPVNTVAVQATLIATTDMDDQHAYDIVRTLIENQADIGHARGAYITPQNAVQSISVDFHPGARRFFQSIGVLN